MRLASLLANPNVVDHHAAWGVAVIDRPASEAANSQVERETLADVTLASGVLMAKSSRCIF
jgi:hypothetical protein